MKTFITDTHKYEIVEEMPMRYGVWNIPHISEDKNYLPLYDLIDVSNHQINADTLKAIKCDEGIEEIRKASSWGVRNSRQARSVIEKGFKQSGTEEEYIYNIAVNALPFMEKIKGL